jgi:hypothetical protein
MFKGYKYSQKGGSHKSKKNTLPTASLIQSDGRQNQLAFSLNYLSYDCIKRIPLLGGRNTTYRLA